MHGLMQHRELLISSIIEHAARHHPAGEIVSRRDDGSLARTDYRSIEQRARKLAEILACLGVRPGDRVGTLAMNSDRHVELYYAISGMGAVCTTINPRLAVADIGYIADHAQVEVIFADPAFLPIINDIAPALGGTLRHVIVIGETAEIGAHHLPGAVSVHAYETLMQTAQPIAAWPVFDERTASALCYTSGTTGRPKGVLYSHRSTVLFAMMMNNADVIALRATDRVMPGVPMFHVNAWGFPFAAPLAGAALLMPGRHLDPASVLDLLNRESATVAAGVPTIWLGLHNHLRDGGGELTSLQRILSGGAAFPRALMAEYQARDVAVCHAWGMTESSPVATYYAPKPASAALDAAAKLDQAAKQGRVVFGVDVRAALDDDADAPWDGATQGNLMFRGHWVASAYYRMPDSDVGDGGWFPTGDVGVIDPDGYVMLTDRTKDLIKSGGEWISSIAIENIAIGHPDVLEAAAIAVPDPKWGERPLLIAVPRAGSVLAADDLRAFYRDKVQSWSVPDRVVIADSLPHGATGKILKTELRRIYASDTGG